LTIHLNSTQGGVGYLCIYGSGKRLVFLFGDATFSLHDALEENPRGSERMPVVDEGALVPVKDEPAARPDANTRALLAEVAAARAGVQDYLFAQLNLKR